MPAQTVVAFDALAGNPRNDAALLAGSAAPVDVVSLVSMQFAGPASRTPWFSADFRQRIKQLLEDNRVVSIGTGDAHCQRHAVFVQIDDAYLGGERNGGKAGHGSENKQAFLIAMQTGDTFTAPRFVVIEPVRSFDNTALQDWIARRLAPGCEVYTDGLACFRRLWAHPAISR